MSRPNRIPVRDMSERNRVLGRLIPASVTLHYFDSRHPELGWTPVTVASRADANGLVAAAPDAYRWPVSLAKPVSLVKRAA